ncbi:hypothetical protein LX90_001679 [Lentzea flava]|nr:hypothetical protein [Lentzea flava]
MLGAKPFAALDNVWTVSPQRQAVVVAQGAPGVLGAKHRPDGQPTAYRLTGRANP